MSLPPPGAGANTPSSAVSKRSGNAPLAETVNDASRPLPEAFSSALSTAVWPERRPSARAESVPAGLASTSVSAHSTPARDSVAPEAETPDAVTLALTSWRGPLAASFTSRVARPAIFWPRKAPSLARSAEALSAPEAVAAAVSASMSAEASSPGPLARRPSS